MTDVQLKYTKDKKFRHFGFVGFKSESAADAARKHFDNTLMGATKISVEFCADWGAESGKAKPRAWSKYSADSSAYIKAPYVLNLAQSLCGPNVKHQPPYLS